MAGNSKNRRQKKQRSSSSLSRKERKRKVLERFYKKLRAVNPTLSEAELDKLFLTQYRRKSAEKKMKLQKKKPKVYRKKTNQKVGFNKTSKKYTTLDDGSSSVRTVSGGAVSPK